jgi:TIR domain-containing protein
VAIPLIGAGDQGYDPAEMLSATIQAAVSWMKRGLTLRTLKVVVCKHDEAQKALAGFLRFRRNYEESLKEHSSRETSVGPLAQYDVFISYAHDDLEIASFVGDSLKAPSQNVRIFLDKTDLRVGASWPMQIADALDHSRRVIALYSAKYWSSKNCQLEFMAAFVRQNDTGAVILFQTASACSRLAAELL